MPGPVPESLSLATSATSSAASSFEASPVFGTPPTSDTASITRQVVIGVVVAVLAFFVTRAITHKGG
ncbi:MAG TPA: hypothetical protein VFM56_10595 [Solimonas sp.]|nr:hypothetical protein [Solimonas sp.]